MSLCISEGVVRTGRSTPCVDETPTKVGMGSRSTPCVDGTVPTKVGTHQGRAVPTKVGIYQGRAMPASGRHYRSRPQNFALSEIQ